MSIEAIDFNRYRNIVILTGAGISAASGLPTFRGMDLGALMSFTRSLAVDLGSRERVNAICPAASLITGSSIVADGGVLGRLHEILFNRQNCNVLRSIEVAL